MSYDAAPLEALDRIANPGALERVTEPTRALVDPWSVPWSLELWRDGRELEVALVSPGLPRQSVRVRCRAVPIAATLERRIRFWHAAGVDRMGRAWGPRVRALYETANGEELDARRYRAGLARAGRYRR